MNRTEERAKVRSAYDSPKWRSKVDKMPDQQVHEIYKRLQTQIKLGVKK